MWLKVLLKISQAYSDVETFFYNSLIVGYKIKCENDMTEEKFDHTGSHLDARPYKIVA
jgi:hypothetical protein